LKTKYPTFWLPAVELNMNEMFPDLTEESISLARKAKAEKMKNDVVLTKCPKCHQTINVDEFYDKGILKRISIGCKCGYVFDGEIYD